MVSRATRLVAVSVLGFAVPAAAQRPGTIELGGFLRYTEFDNSLALGNTIGVGGRLAAYVRPDLALEVALSRTSADAPGTNAVTHTPAHFRVVYSPEVAERLAVLAGAGYVRNKYGNAYDRDDGGIAVLLGVRYWLNDLVALRLEASEDFVTSPANESPQVTFNGNLGIHVGLSVLLNTGGAAR
jgi:hypothetical protein